MCKYDKIYTDEELQAADWLFRTLDAIVAKGPEHRSYENAKRAHDMIDKLIAHRDELHSACHAFESRLTMYAEAKMILNERGEA